MTKKKTRKQCFVALLSTVSSVINRLENINFVLIVSMKQRWERFVHSLKLNEKGEKK